jgi:RimJ/RimL family protein N-acetyltransferase
MIRGERVWLRTLVLDDVPALVAYRNDPSVVRFQSWTSYSEDRARELVSAMATSAPGVDGSWYQWGITLDGQLVGDIGLRTFDEARQGEIGFTLSPAARGRGLAFEACGVVLAHAFGKLRFHRVIASIDPLNAAAASLLTRLGFRREGLERASVFVHGAWADDERWALLADEFHSPRGE